MDFYVRVHLHHDPQQHFLMPSTRRGRHEQLPVNRLVAVPVVGKRADHLGRVVQRCGHAHNVASAESGTQHGITSYDAGQPRSCWYRINSWSGGIVREPLGRARVGSQ